jgi:hypothetical protein
VNGPERDSPGARELRIELASWLGREVPDAPRPGLLGDVLEAARVTRQRRAIPRWFPLPAVDVLGNRTIRGAAAVMLVCALVAGGALLASTLTPAPSGVVSGPTSSPTASQAPSPRQAIAGPLEPGVAYSVSEPAPVTFSVPKGWSLVNVSPTESVLANTRLTAAVAFFVTNDLFRDPCHWQQGTLEPPLGPTAADLVTALAKLPDFAVTGPTATVIGGQAAQTLRMVQTVPGSSCDGAQLKVWSWTPTGREQDLYGVAADVSVLETNGTRLVVMAWGLSQADPSASAELGSIVASIGLGGPSPSPTPSASAAAVATELPSTGLSLPSLDVATWVDFTSGRYGISAKFPPGWAVTPATAPLIGQLHDPGPEALQNAFGDQVASDNAISTDGMAFFITSQAIPSGMSEAAWWNAYSGADVCPHCAPGKVPGTSAACFPLLPSKATPITVDGQPGYEHGGLRACDFTEAVILVGGRAYQLTAYAYFGPGPSGVGKVFDQALFDAWLSTIHFDPASANDTPLTSPGPS